MTKAPQHHQIAALYEAHAPQIIATLRKMFGNGPPDPEDVTQRAFQRVLERGDWSDIDDLKAYLWRTARNICLKGRRHENVRSAFDFEIEQLFFPRRGDTSSPERVLGAEEELRLINEALRAMPEKRRQAFLLNRVEGLTVTEVAKRLGIARSPATRHISRAYRDIELHIMRKGADGQ
ncbi:MAG: sigma-70 family RNA polymerase sigma factor [Pseudomonadota bacterium]